MIRFTTLLDMNRHGLNWFEKSKLADVILPKLEKNGLIIIDGTNDCRIFIGIDLSPLRKFMENYKHGISNSDVPLVMGDSVLR